MKCLQFISVCLVLLSVVACTPESTPPSSAMEETATDDVPIETVPTEIVPTATKKPTAVPKATFMNFPTGKQWYGELYNMGGKQMEYIYRAVMETPKGMAWGPDGNLYIADLLGRQIVKVTPAGEISQFATADWDEDGPYWVTFDSTGTLWASGKGQIYRFNPDGSYATINPINGEPTGGIIFNANDELFYVDTWNNTIYQLVDGQSIRIAEASDVQNPVFGPDGRLYLGKAHQNRIVAVDTTTKEVEQVFKGPLGNDPIFLAFDQNGDLWARGSFHLYHFSKDWTPLQITIDGQTFQSGEIPRKYIDTAGGILFDQQGNLWIGSYTSRLAKLIPTDDKQGFTFEIVHAGFASSAMAIGLNGELYANNFLTDEIWEFGSRLKEPKVILSMPNISSLATDPEGNLYIGTQQDEILKMAPGEEPAVLAKYSARAMAFGTDGDLYIIAGKYNTPRSIVRIDPVSGAFETLPTVLNSKDYRLASDPNGGFFLYEYEQKQLFRLSFDGKTEKILSAAPLMEWSIHQFDLAVTPEGNAYMIGYILYRIQDNGKATDLLRYIFGDPLGAVFSLDGKTLYVAASGVIHAINIERLP